MKVIKCSQMADYNFAIRNYYDLGDVRILNATLYKNNTNNIIYHKHNIITEVLYIIEGTVICKIKGQQDTIVTSNKVVIFYPRELHSVISQGDFAKVMVFKYISNNIDLLDQFKTDYEEQK